MKLRNGLSYFYYPLKSFNNMMSIKGNGSIQVLIYHDIPPQMINVFKKQVEFIAKHYRFIDLNSFNRMLKGEDVLKGKNVLLTFDDGFKSNLEIAQKVLNPLGIKALFFITTDFINLQGRNELSNFVTQNLFPGLAISDDISNHLRPLTWSDLEYLLDSGHSIGAHTKSHCRLSMIKPEDLSNEIIGSGDYLEQRLGIKINCFAYPFGDIGSINLKALKIAKERYRFVFSGIRGRNNSQVNPLALRREAVSLEDPLTYLGFMLEGGLSPYYYYKRKQLDEMADKV